MKETGNQTPGFKYACNSTLKKKLHISLSIKISATPVMKLKLIAYYPEAWE